MRLQVVHPPCVTKRILWSFGVFRLDIVNRPITQIVMKNTSASQSPWIFWCDGQLYATAIGLA
jgi:hypothetical protein